MNFHDQVHRLALTCFVHAVDASRQSCRTQARITLSERRRFRCPWIWEEYIASEREVKRRYHVCRGTPGHPYGIPSVCETFPINKSGLYSPGCDFENSVVISFWSSCKSSDKRSVSIRKHAKRRALVIAYLLPHSSRSSRKATHP